METKAWMLPSDGALQTHHVCFSPKIPNGQLHSDQVWQGLERDGEEEMGLRTFPKRAWSSGFWSELSGSVVWYAAWPATSNVHLMGVLLGAAPCSWSDSRLLPEHLFLRAAGPPDMQSDLPQRSPVVSVLALLQSIKCYWGKEAICRTKGRLFLHTSLPSVILLP